jgi:uncharacterized protein (DUF885 family)
MRHAIRHALLATLALGVLMSCATVPKNTGTVTQEDAGAALEELGSHWWDATLQSSPFWATHLGDRRFDQRVPDVSEAAEKAHLAMVREHLKILESIDVDALSPRDKVVRDVLHTKLTGSLDAEVCQDRLWGVDHLWGPHIQLAQMTSSHSIRSPEDVATLETRYRAAPAWFKAHADNLREGLSKGYSPYHLAVSKVVEQARALASKEASKTPFVSAVKWPETWDAKTKATATDVLTRAVDEAIKPALVRYADALEREIYPRSRRENVGAAGLPNGDRCYGSKIRSYTGSNLGPKAIHRIGLEELKTLRKDMLEIAEEVSGKRDLKAFMETLESRKDQVYQSRDELLADAQKIMDRAFKKLPTMFGRLPKTPIEIKEMEAYRAKDAPAAFYHPAPADGSRKAAYVVNTYAPESRPRYNMEALSFHEAVPGHHLQIAIARETPDIPSFQRYMGQTAYVEGWALYSELLAAEMGLYTGPLDHFGKLNFQAWRACRLVVDTGLHALGWSRDQAIEFMVEHTANSRADVEVEIDRYIVWPGQALGYMMGRIAIQGFRAKAEKTLGDAFDLRGFHDEILRYGPVPIDVLEGIVNRWVERVQSQN